MNRDDSPVAVSDWEMKTIERWVLQISDSDWTWKGFGWMRPEKHERIGPWYILFSSVLLGVPGIVVGIGLLFVAFGQVASETWVAIVVVVVLVELLLHAVFAHYWNRRATELMRAHC